MIKGVGFFRSGTGEWMRKITPIDCSSTFSWSMWVALAEVLSSSST